MANTIRIKRRASSGSTGAPSSLKNGELAYNESDNRLYYGYGDDGAGNATSVPAIAGSGLLDTDYVDIDSTQTVTGAKTFSGVLNSTGDFKIDSVTVSASAANINQLTGTTLGNVVTLNKGISDTNLLQSGASVTNNDFLRVAATGGSSSKIIGRSAAEVRGDIGAAPTGGVNTIVTVGTITTGTWNGSVIADAYLSGNTAHLDTTQTFTGAKTFDAVISADGGISSNGSSLTVGSATTAVSILKDLEVAADLTVDTTTLHVDSANNNVGVGTITPSASYKLDVVGAVRASTNIHADGNLSSTGNFETYGSATITSIANANADTDIFLVADSNGLVKKRSGAQVRSDIGATRDALGIDTDDTVTFGNIVTAGYLRGPAVFTIDPAAHGDDSGKVVIAGDLQVDGTTTTVNSTEVTIADKSLTLANTANASSTLNSAGLLLGVDTNSPPALGSGALVEFVYVHTDTRMVLSSAMKITGGLEDTVIDGGSF